MNNINKISKKVFFIFLTLSFQLSVKGFEPNDIPSSLFSKDCKKENKQFIVKNVFDGDTILVQYGDTAIQRYSEITTGQSSKQEYKVRLLGIDAYEYDQPYGKIAKEFLTKLVLNKKVCIETDVEEEDIYERTLGYVFSDKKFVNEELLKSGNAILYNFPPNIKYIKRLKAAQIYGRQNMLGVWKNQNYIKETPSQWRKKHPYKKRLLLH